MLSRKYAPKKIPETDAIFEKLATVNQQADVAETTLRLSIDTKANPLERVWCVLEKRWNGSLLETI